MTSAGPRRAADRMRSVIQPSFPAINRVEAVIQAAVNRDDFTPSRSSDCQSPMKTSRVCILMPNRLSRTNACCRRFAERETLTFCPTFDVRTGSLRQKLTSDQRVSYKSTGLFREIAVDALVFEFIGLAMARALRHRACGPSSRRRCRRIGNY